jgi:hypothetical protein
MDIGLLSNPVLADGTTVPVLNTYWTFEASGEHCYGHYIGESDQLYAGIIRSLYERNHIRFTVEATVTAEHPAKTEEQLQEFHNTQYFFPDDCYRNIVTENIVTENGIPVTICTVFENEDPHFFTVCFATFAANDISYTINYAGCDYAQDHNQTMAVFREILEGFTME